MESKNKDFIEIKDNPYRPRTLLYLLK